MQLENYREKPTGDQEHYAACNRIWNEHIRTDLIFSKNLMLCKGCLSFYYNRSDADHPREHVVLSQYYLAEQDVTSLDKFVQLFKPSLKTAGKSDDSSTNLKYFPVFSFKHRACSPSYGILEANETQTPLVKESIKYFIDQVQHLKKQTAKQKAEIEDLRQENDHLLRSLVRLRANSSLQTSHVARLASNILLYCDEECCCEDQVSQKDNKTK
jgi:hypothetical protein